MQMSHICWNTPKLKDPAEVSDEFDCAYMFTFPDCSFTVGAERSIETEHNENRQQKGL